MEKILLGTGVLSWSRSERQSDRYGSVFLTDENSVGDKIPCRLNIVHSALTNNVGKKGSLRVKVLDTRESTHIGDMFRGVGPVTPNKGEDFELGKGGKLFTYTLEKYLCIGLEQRRQTDWLDIHALYRAHEQTVELYFIPA